MRALGRHPAVGRRVLEPPPLVLVGVGTRRVRVAAASEFSRLSLRWFPPRCRVIGAFSRPPLPGKERTLPIFPWSIAHRGCCGAFFCLFLPPLEVHDGAVGGMERLLSTKVGGMGRPFGGPLMVLRLLCLLCGSCRCLPRSTGLPGAVAASV